MRLLWNRVLPFVGWRGRLDRRGLRDDGLAGLLGALVLLPQSVLFAAVAGLPLEYGVYAAVIPVIVAALWGASWHLACGSTAAMSLLMLTALAPLALPGSPEYIKLVLLLAFLIGLVQLVVGVRRLGAFGRLISPAVLTGFTTGVALLIAAGQLRSVLGIPLERNVGPWKAFTGLFRYFLEINTYLAAVAALTVLVVVLMRRWLPHWPQLLVALLVASAFAWGVNQYYGSLRTGIYPIDAITLGWPAFSKPDLTWKTFGQLAPIALAALLLALAQTATTLRALALRSGQRPDDNRELVAQGLANVVGSFFSAHVVSASAQRSALNLTYRARTPLATMLAAVLVFAVMWFAVRYAMYLPLAVFSALLLVIAWDLVDVAAIRATWRASREDSAVLIITLLATLTIDLVHALFLGVLLSLLLYGLRSAGARLVDVKPVAQLTPVRFLAQTGTADCPQLKMMQLEGAINFASAEGLQAEFEGIDAEQRHLLLVTASVTDVDGVGAALLGREAQRRQALGGGLYLFDVGPGLLRALQWSGAHVDIGPDNIFAPGSDPVAVIFERLRPGTCAACERRIFEVCPKPVELTWKRPPGDKTTGRYTVPPTAWARPAGTTGG